MTTHNPIQAIQQLQSILASPSKKIGFLFGAGISMEKLDGTELIVGMNDQKDDDGKVLKEGMTTLSTKDFPSPQKEAIELMEKEIVAEGNSFNVETMLSIISEKERAAGSEKLCGLTKLELQNLRKDIEKKIQDMVSIHVEGAGLNIEDTSHNTFSKWISNANREAPVEIFTTNYDYLLELALEEQQIPYFDGFVGSYEAFFCPEWIGDDLPVKDWVKLWKLHGSLGWSQNERQEIIRTSGKTGEAMIYPSFLKYDHSKKQPYLSYMDRLSQFLRQEDSVLFVCGYSFGDQHINEIILTSLGRSRSSHVFVLNYGKMKEEDVLSKEISQLNSRISVYAKRTGVIGGKFGQWKNSTKESSSKYFKEDKKKTADDWDGKGDLSLGEFKYFTEFLSDFYKVYNDQ